MCHTAQVLPAFFCGWEKQIKGALLDKKDRSILPAPGEAVGAMLAWRSERSQAQGSLTMQASKDLDPASLGLGSPCE
ncbi:hypothetical protein A15D_03229, partial [Alcanivorax sp. MD8A]